MNNSKRIGASSATHTMKGNKGMNGCCLCNQISGNETGDLISQMLGEEEYVRRIPIETNRFAVVPSLGPIAPGHSLLCPKEHVESIVQLLRESSTESEILNEMGAFLQRVRAILRELFSKPIHIFEHGPSPDDSRVICSVDHAHLHLLPADVEIVSQLRADSRWEAVHPDFRDLHGKIGRREYQYYQSPDGRAFAAISGDGFESQYLRRVFAQTLGREGRWNWREYPKPEACHSLFREIQKLESQS